MVGETIGQTIKRIRNQKHLTQEDVARDGGAPLTREYVNQLEHDKVKNPGRLTLASLGRGLKESIQIFFDDVGYASNKSPALLVQDITDRLKSFVPISIFWYILVVCSPLAVGLAVTPLKTVCYNKDRWLLHPISRAGELPIC